MAANDQSTSDVLRSGGSNVGTTYLGARSTTHQRRTDDVNMPPRTLADVMKALGIEELSSSDRELAHSLLRSYHRQVERAQFQARNEAEGQRQNAQARAQMDLERAQHAGSERRAAEGAAGQALTGGTVPLEQGLPKGPIPVGPLPGDQEPTALARRPAPVLERGAELAAQDDLARRQARMEEEEAQRSGLAGLPGRTMARVGREVEAAQAGQRFFGQLGGRAPGVVGQAGRAVGEVIDIINAMLPSSISGAALTEDLMANGYDKDTSELAGAVFTGVTSLLYAAGGGPGLLDLATKATRVGMQAKSVQPAVDFLRTRLNEKGVYIDPRLLKTTTESATQDADFYLGTTLAERGMVLKREEYPQPPTSVADILRPDATRAAGRLPEDIINTARRDAGVQDLVERVAQSPVASNIVATALSAAGLAELSAETGEGGVTQAGTAGIPLAMGGVIAKLLKSGKFRGAASREGRVISSMLAAAMHVGKATGEPMNKAESIEWAVRTFGKEVLPHVDQIWAQAKKTLQTDLAGRKFAAFDKLVKFHNEGKELPSWYGGRRELAKIVGKEHVDRAAGLAAALSANTPWARNSDNFARVWTAYRAGELEGLALDAVQETKAGNKVRVSSRLTELFPDIPATQHSNIVLGLSGQPLEGNKVETFRLAMMDHPLARVWGVVDGQMTRMLYPGVKGAEDLTDAQYHGAQLWLQELSRKVGDNDVRETQQALWVGQKLFKGLRKDETLETAMQTILRDMLKHGGGQIPGAHLLGWQGGNVPDEAEELMTEMWAWRLLGKAAIGGLAGINDSDQAEEGMVRGLESAMFSMMSGTDARTYYKLLRALTRGRLLPEITEALRISNGGQRAIDPARAITPADRDMIAQNILTGVIRGDQFINVNWRILREPGALDEAIGHLADIGETPDKLPGTTLHEIKLAAQEFGITAEKVLTDDEAMRVLPDVKRVMAMKDLFNAGKQRMIHLGREYIEGRDPNGLEFMHHLAIMLEFFKKFVRWGSETGLALWGYREIKATIGEFGAEFGNIRNTADLTPSQRDDLIRRILSRSTTPDPEPFDVSEFFNRLLAQMPAEQLPFAPGVTEGATASKGQLAPPGPLTGVRSPVERPFMETPQEGPLGQLQSTMNQAGSFEGFEMQPRPVPRGATDLPQSEGGVLSEPFTLRQAARATANNEPSALQRMQALGEKARVTQRAEAAPTPGMGEDITQETLAEAAQTLPFNLRQVVRLSPEDISHLAAAVSEMGVKNTGQFLRRLFTDKRLDAAVLAGDAPTIKNIVYSSLVNTLLAGFGLAMQWAATSVLLTREMVVAPAFAATVGLLRGGQDRVFFSEIPANIIGLLSSFADAVIAGGPAGHFARAAGGGTLGGVAGAVMAPEGERASGFRMGATMGMGAGLVGGLAMRGRPGIEAASKRFTPDVANWGDIVRRAPDDPNGVDQWAVDWFAKGLDWFGRGVQSFGGAYKAEEIFTRSMVERAVLWREATRMAIQNGESPTQARHWFNYLMDNGDARVAKIAEETADYITLTSPLGAWAEPIRQHPLGWLISPFLTTMVNAVKVQFDWLGVPLNKYTGLQVLASRTAEELASPSAEVRDLARSRLAAGSMVMAYGVYLAHNGVISGRESITKPGLREAEREERAQYTIEVGKERVGLERLGILGQHLMFAADFYNLAREWAYDPDDATAYQRLQGVAAAMVLATTNVMSTPTSLSQFSELYKIVTAGRSEDLNAWQLVRSTATMVIPTGARQIRRAIDPVGREVYDVIDAFFEATPGLSSKLYPRVGNDGEVQRHGEGTIFEAFVPLRVRKPQGDPVNEFLIEKKINLGKPKGWIFGPGDTALGGEKPENGVQLDDEQKYHYNRLAGNHLKLPADRLVFLLPSFQGTMEQVKLPDEAYGKWDLLTALVKDETFKAMPAKAQERIVLSIHHAYDRAAQTFMIQTKEERDQQFKDILGARWEATPVFPDLTSSFREKQAGRAEALGGPGARIQVEQMMR